MSWGLFIRVSKREAHMHNYRLPGCERARVIGDVVFFALASGAVVLMAYTLLCGG